MAHQIHDKGYKRLFSNKRFFQQLMESFVTQDWVKDLDFSSCEAIDKSFISEHYKETESDLIYKVKYKGKESYICVLIEFQSTIQWHTALRVLNYITNFWMDYVASNRKVRSLPPVFPIVLYNGEDDWDADEKLESLINDVELLSDYAPHFKYFKIDENAYSIEQLLKIRNLVSTLFLSEAHYDLNLIKAELLTLFDSEPDAHAISLLLNWFKQLMVNKRLEKIDYDSLEYVYKSKDEARSMIETAIERERQRFYQSGWDAGKIEGIQIGEARGRAEGEAKGKAEGEARGKAEGEARGKAEGEARGKAEGEANNKRKVARAMLSSGQVTAKFISEVTGLSLEEIALLQDEKAKH